MLDENLPTFRFKASDNPLSTIVFFTQNGADPAPEYIYRRADPALPVARNKYAVALTDPYGHDVIYAEVLVDPEWEQPTLSAAEIRAANGQPPPAIPHVPDSFVLRLYNPDHDMIVKMVPGSWGRSESWEFEMPTQTFRQPSTSQIDRRNTGSPLGDLVPKLMFRWRRDGRLSKDMTCYMTGKNLAGKKSKEPDITVALFKVARETALTIYEPNMQRVEVEDRKGLEIALVLSAEVIRDMYLAPLHDLFNFSGPGSVAAVIGKRKNSRPIPPPAAANVTTSAAAAAAAAAAPGAPAMPTMSGAVGVQSGPAGRPSAQRQTAQSTAAIPMRPAAKSSQKEAAIDTETKRLQVLVQQEERERERRDHEEQKRIKMMLDEEERQSRRRAAEVEEETERLRREYGIEGQDLDARPQLPLRPTPTPQPRLQQHNSRPNGGLGLYLQNPSASVSGFFHRDRPDENRRNMRKKRSVNF